VTAIHEIGTDRTSPGPLEQTAEARSCLSTTFNGLLWPTLDKSPVAPVRSLAGDSRFALSFLSVDNMIGV